MTDGGLDEDLEVSCHARDRRFLEEVGVVQERPGEYAALFGEGELEIKLGRLRGELDGLELEPRERERAHWRVLKDEHHLEERSAAEVAWSAELLDEPLER